MKNGKVEIDGNKHWFLNGELHRVGSPAIECANGDTEWWFEGERHRVDGPAIELVYGYKHWYLHGKRHRDNGPAVDCATGHKEWHLNGTRLSEEEFSQWLVKKYLNEKLQSSLVIKSSVKRKKL